MAPIMAFLLITSGLFILASKQTTGFFIPIVVGSNVVILGAAIAVSYRKLDLAAALLFLFPVMAAVAALFSWGYLSTAGIIMCYFSVLFGAIVLPRKALPFLPIGMIVVYGFVAFHVGPRGSVATPEDVGTIGPMAQTIEIAILSSVFFGLGYYLLNEFEKRRRQLAQLVASLEDRVAERTRDLTIAANVSRQVTQVLDLTQLLPELTELTRASFNLYHVSIFLLDEATKTLRLEAGTGDAGRQMVSDHKQFQVDEHGLVPLSARQRQPQVINDVRESPDHTVNPVLPDTRSEVALPMIIGGHLIGVLDLQSEQVNKFSPDDIKVLITLAEQIAVAVRNANLFNQAQEATLEAEQANRVKSQFLAAMSHEL
jgi:putative methionine-R-sulfoxide reductase with GAF domain